MSLRLILLFCGIALAAQNCYFPNGTQGTYFPCNENAAQSHCCGGTDACLSNGYCFQTNNGSAQWGLRIARGMCTDWELGKDDCPQYCEDVAQNGTVTVFMVGDYPTALFCCSSDYNPETRQCNTPTHGSSEPFSLPLGQVIYDRKTGALLSSFQETDTSPDSSSSGAAAPTTTIIRKESSNAAAIGAGVGVPLGVLLLGALAAVALLWTKLKKAQRANAEQAQQLLHNQDVKDPHAFQDPMGGNNGQNVRMQGYPQHWQAQAPGHFEAPEHAQVHELPQTHAQVELGGNEAWNK